MTAPGPTEEPLDPREWLHEPPPSKPFGDGLGQIKEGWEPMYRVGYAIDPYGPKDTPVLWVWPPGTTSGFPLDDRWAWEVHDDGTVTVIPSIGLGEGVKDYHGWLRRGVWTNA